MTRPDPIWSCMDHCGACCRLAPDERPEALEALSPEQQELYLSMVGPDGWCLHFDTGSRRCRIYDTRPDFCRVSSLCSLFGVDDAEADAFAISCCRQQFVRCMAAAAGNCVSSKARSDLLEPCDD